MGKFYVNIVSSFNLHSVNTNVSHLQEFIADSDGELERFTAIVHDHTGTTYTHAMGWAERPVFLMVLTSPHTYTLSNTVYYLTPHCTCTTDFIAQGVFQWWF